MKKLKVAFLWHQHQPYYRINDEFVLPWVLLHGTKDYYDLPELLYEFPEIKQTFNFAPSLSLQLEEYVKKQAKDKIQQLTLLKADSLNEEQKNEILEYFFACQIDNMIKPYPRYKELLEKSRDKSFAVYNFQTQDWLDLQVWYNLTWFGYFSRQKSFIKRLFAKGKDFSEIEKITLIDEQYKILSDINNQYKKLIDLGQIELSCSPMYHPILPLLCDSRNALDNLPNAQMPDPLYIYPSDADAQIKKGIDYFYEIFGIKPNGMWPSEGSVSNEVLKLIAGNDIKWVASDELILANSTDSDYKHTDKYFPRLINNNDKSLVMLFRDHNLSDKIGFEYSRWNEHDAAEDFVNTLVNIKYKIAETYGQEALEYAVVPVILDGENCWEYYRENGIPFLRTLFQKLSKSNELITVTCSEASEIKNVSFLKPLNSIKAGSWINGNFSIWIGDREDIKGWEMLGKARKAFEDRKNLISNEDSEKAFKAIMIAEGSDWFWWFGPEHPAINKPVFDRIFRFYISEIYKNIGLNSPDDVHQPISADLILNKKPLFDFTPNIVSLEINKEWNNAGIYNPNTGLSAMHRVGSIVNRILYCRDSERIYLNFELNNKMADDTRINIDFFNPFNFKVEITPYHLKINDRKFADINFISYNKNYHFICSFEYKNLIDSLKQIELKFQTIHRGTFSNYPEKGNILLEF
jgi:alpha-amylase/alpha-mannosidase (GH57 family)